MVVRARRSVGAVFAAVALVAGAAGCDPPPPDTHLTLTSLDFGGDVAPGDGVCEATAGLGDCTLRAAVDEANALHAAGVAGWVVVEAPASPPAYVIPPFDPPLVVTGRLRIEGDGAWLTEIELTTTTVAAGARLQIHDAAIDLPGCDGGFCTPRNVPHLVVEGTFAGVGVVVNEGTFQVIDVAATGALVLVDSSVHGTSYGGLEPPDGADQGIRNAGIALLDRVTIDVAGTDGSLTTLGAGRSILRDTTIHGRVRPPFGPFPELDPGPSCAGTVPESLGGNTTWDASCALTGPGDSQGPTT